VTRPCLDKNSELTNSTCIRQVRSEKLVRDKPVSIKLLNNLLYIITNWKSFTELRM